jgi:hypothetical protein
VRIGGNVLAACFIIDPSELGGAAKVRKLGVPVRTLVGFVGHQRTRSTSRSGFEPRPAN